MRFLLLILIAIRCSAAAFYVAQSSSGSDDGSSVGNAHSLAWLNTSGNWGSGAGKVNPGDTVHLVGTLTQSLTIQASGATSNPTTILFEPGAAFACSATNLTVDSSTGVLTFIQSNTRDWITIDGGANGKMTCTDNGSVPLPNQIDVIGIRAVPANHFTAQNLTITNLYKRTVSTDPRMGNTTGVSVIGNDVKIQNCFLGDADTLIGYGYGTGSSSNLLITGNTIYRCNHGISIGTASAAANLSNVTVSNNIIDWLSVWDGNAGNHLDGMIIFNESGSLDGILSGCVISANTIGPNIGVFANTAGVFLDDYVVTQTTNMQVVNNLFLQGSGYSWSNGHISARFTTNSIIANNTFVNLATTPSGLGVQVNAGNLGITNNIFYSIGTPISLGPATSAPVGFQSDKNVFYAFLSGSGSFYDFNFNAANYAYWQGTIGHDLNSVHAQPILDSGYAPIPSDIVARGNGANLSSYFTTDKSGVLRATSGAWVVGAFVNSGRLLMAQNLRVVSGTAGN